MAGNPPWIKVGWNDVPLLNEFEPLLGVRVTKSAGYNRARPTLLTDAMMRIEYTGRFEAGEGISAFLNDRALYPYLAGVQTNHWLASPKEEKREHNSVHSPRVHVFT
jgi:hypothetical protein